MSGWALVAVTVCVVASAMALEETEPMEPMENIELIQNVFQSQNENWIPRGCKCPEGYKCQPHVKEKWPHLCIKIKSNSGWHSRKDTTTTAATALFSILMAPLAR